MDKFLFCSGVRILAGTLVFCMLFFVLSFWMQGAGVPAAPTDGGVVPACPVIVLDAGHGGEDGGAVGVNGITEKELNLRITLMLGEMLTAAGVPVVYTRTEDRLLYTEEQNIRGQRKVYDLRNRLAVAQATPGAVLVSIHMNKFSDGRYSGLQVYYSKNDPRSAALAGSLRAAVRSGLQPENRRATKPAGDSIYLLDRAEFPAVLVECGFLSHAGECEKLCTAEYERALSFSLFCGIMEYIASEIRA